MSGDTAAEFLREITDSQLTPVDRAVALLWWHGLEDSSSSKSARVLAREIEQAGFGQQNVTRIKGGLERDLRTAKLRNGEFPIRASARKSLDDEYLSLLQVRLIPRCSTILTLELVVGTRQYIERVALQL